MEKCFNISREDLKYLINETCRKLALLNETVKEGGLYGHMEHPYDINEFTFGDLRQLVYDLFAGKIENISEKLDGMNIFATVTPNGEVRFARNSQQVSGDDAGMGIPEMEERWGGEGNDPTILQAYENAYYLFSDAVKKLPDPVGFFNGDGFKLYANCEVIDPNHPNIIHYGKTALSVHGLIGFTTEEKPHRFEVPENEEGWRMEQLRQVLPTVNSTHGLAQVTPFVAIQVREDGMETVKNLEAKLDHIEEVSNTGDENTIIDYKKAMIVSYLEYAGLGNILNQPFSDLFITRWAYIDKDKNSKPEDVQKMPNAVQIRKIVQTSGVENAKEIYAAAYEFEKTKLPEVFSDLMSPLENFVYELGNAAIEACQGLANAGYEDKTIASLAEQLEIAKETVANSNDLEVGETLAWCLKKLEYLGNKLNAAEGIVFNYKGHTLKLTGSFAALNRAINTRITLQRKQRKNQA